MNRDVTVKEKKTLDENQVILDFLQSFFSNNNITTHIMHSPEAFDPSIDLYLRSKILSCSKQDNELSSKKAASLCAPNTILCIMDEYSCEYVLLLLPGYDHPVYFIIGPFTYEMMTEDKIMNIFDQCKFPAQLYKSINFYYSSLPYISNFSGFQSLLHCIGSKLWKSPNNYKMKFVHNENHVNKQSSYITTPPTFDTAVQFIEARYKCEHKLMKCISLGQTDAALEESSKFYKLGFPQRISNPLRDTQNKMIILNTLCRKAAQTGKVSPFYLDQISTKYALKIEASTSLDALSGLVEDMIRGYCMLVKTHSLKDYSAQIQKVISYISMNLTEDLSLSAIAKKFSLSSNYLSALFKKEVKMTLTEYVNIQKIDHSIYLLNTTLLPIQSVAELSGFLDVNYYIRLFKKYKKMTPKQYQKMIHEE